MPPTTAIIGVKTGQW